MNSFRKAHEQTKEAVAKRQAEDEKAMLDVADLFKTPQGKRVLALLCRRFGVLGRRFRKNDRGELNAIRAGINDGEAAVVLFILECLQASGEEEITLPL